MHVTRAPTVVSNVNYIDSDCTLVKRIKSKIQVQDSFILVFVGYLYKSNYECNKGIRSLLSNNHSRLSEVVDFCNGNSNCNCIDLINRNGKDYYRTYPEESQRLVNRPVKYDSWV